MDASFESAELERWMQDLVNAEARIVPAVRAVVVKGALNIKNDARRRFTALRVGGYLPHYARAIGYDITPTMDGAEAVIGPDSSLPQGGMGLAIEEGTSRHAPMPHLYPSLDAEEPKTVEALAVVGEQVLR